MSFAFLSDITAALKFGMDVGRNHWRDIDTPAQECNELLLGPEMSPVSDESTVAGLTVVAMAGVAAVRVKQLLSSDRISGNRAGGRRLVGKAAAGATAALLGVQSSGRNSQRGQRRN